MIRLRLALQDLQRMRFAYSPLAEVTESLYALHAGLVSPVHRGWYRLIHDDLDTVDTPLLQAAVPARGVIANVLLSGAIDARTGIEQQLEGVAQCNPSRLEDDLRRAWHGADLPAAATDLIAAGAGGPALLAEALAIYWQHMIQPWWPQMRAVLDVDVAYRAAQLTRGGIHALLADLHPELQLTDTGLQVLAASDSDHDLGGTGMLLIPCVFAWPHLLVDPGRTGTPSLTYGPRGVGSLWGATPDLMDQQALDVLLGRARASILRAVSRPRATTELAQALTQTPSAVSSHLSVLRRCGLVTSTRAGRRVLYQQTPLAASLLTASDSASGHRGAHG